MDLNPYFNRRNFVWEKRNQTVSRPSISFDKADSVAF